ncbi:hypothetical protein JCM5805K_2634 [Lactococcus lactis subsp. lactis]|uniref:Uncharacterized protein n=2 Tax=Lactococcus lactis TaxID=1358 RepID=A0AAW5TPI7_9LACT|nr:hypothetical protein [Lactococcus lactis]GAM81510.1 hypothetical protein JCM5805K_2634 [Lactococcus lactis subsp. lactis]
MEFKIVTKKTRQRRDFLSVLTKEKITLSVLTENEKR